MTRRFASPSLRDIVVDTETAFAGEAVLRAAHRRGNAQQLRSDGRLRPPFILSQAQENAAFGLNSKENFTGLKAASGTHRLRERHL